MAQNNIRDAMSSEDLLQTMNRLNELIAVEKKDRKNLEDKLSIASFPEEQEAPPGLAQTQKTNKPALGGKKPPMRPQNEPEEENFFGDPGLLMSIRGMAKEISDLVAQRDSLAGRNPITKNRTNQAPEISLKDFAIETTPGNLNDSEDYSEANQRYFENLEFINRMYQKNKETERNIINQQIKKKQREISEMRAKPEISQMSKILGSLRTQNIPIFERYKMELNRREKAIETLKKALEEDKAIKEPMPDFKPKLRKTSADPRSISEFNAHINNWVQKKNEAIMTRHYQKLSEEMVQSPFHPSIDPRSKMIIESKNYYAENNEGVSERLYRHAKVQKKQRKQKEKDVSHSFQPILCEKSRRIVAKKQKNNDLYKGDDYEANTTVQPSNSNDLSDKEIASNFNNDPLYNFGIGGYERSRKASEDQSSRQGRRFQVMNEREQDEFLGGNEASFHDTDILDSGMDRFYEQEAISKSPIYSDRRASGKNSQLTEYNAEPPSRGPTINSYTDTDMTVGRAAQSRNKENIPNYLNREAKQPKGLGRSNSNLSIKSNGNSSNKSSLRGVPKQTSSRASARQQKNDASGRVFVNEIPYSPELDYILLKAQKHK